MSWLTDKIKEWEASDDPVWLKAQLDILAHEQESLAKENVALREVLGKIHDNYNNNDCHEKQLDAHFENSCAALRALSSPSPQVAKIEAALEAAEAWCEKHGYLREKLLNLDAPLPDDVELVKAVRNLKGGE